VTRRCAWCRGEYPDTQAHEVYTRTAITGPERPTYACDGCIRTNGLLTRPEHATPLGATFIGREGLPPAIAAEQPPRVCTRCGRVVTAYTVRSPAEDDRGPLEVVWCADAEACMAARAASRPLRRLVPPHPG
jgi:hypothetical protein